MTTYIHPTADVSAHAVVGPGTRIWALCQVRDGAVLGSNCIVGRNSFIDLHVEIGSNVKIQNNCSVYEGVTLEDGVFVGPHVTFTNDLYPRAINPNGSLKDASDWTLGRTLVRYGAALGARSVVITGTSIGRWAMIGSGSVVTRDVPDFALVVGSPARIVGWVSAGGVRCASQADAAAATALEEVGGNAG